MKTYRDHLPGLLVNTVSPGLEEGVGALVLSTHLTQILHRVRVRGAAQHHQRGGDVGVAESQAGDIINHLSCSVEDVLHIIV